MQRSHPATTTRLLLTGSLMLWPGSVSSEPSLIVGGQLGAAHHLSQTSQVDGVSGATIEVEDETISELGFAPGLLLDWCVLALGPGDLGSRATVHWTVPSGFVDAGLLLRYRLRLGKPGALGVEPWLGGGIWAGTIGLAHGHWYLLTGGSLGLDLVLPDPRFRLGMFSDLNMVNFRGRSFQQQVEGQTVDMEQRYDSTLVGLAFSIRLGSIADVGP